MRTSRLLAFVLPVLAGLHPLAAQDRTGPAEVRELEEILAGLDAGIAALHRLGRHQESLDLARIAGGVEVRLEQARRSRPDPAPPERSGPDIARQRLDTLRLALAVLQQSDEHGALCTQLEMAIDVLDWSLAGRPAAQIRRLREHAPNDRELARILGIAARQLSAGEMPDRAERVQALARALVQQDERRSDGREREIAQQQIELLLAAEKLLLGADRDREANVVQRMVAAQRVRLDGHSSGRAQLTLAFEPELGAQAEVVLFAARLAAERGQPDLAEQLEGYGKKIAVRAKRAPR